MKRLRLLLFLFPVLCTGLWGLARSSEDTRLHSETLYVFGTLVEVIIHGEAPDTAQDAIAEVDLLFQRLHRDWHAWRAGELTRLNAALALGETHEVSDELARILKQGQALSAQSGGTFDPAIGALIELWGFHDDLPPTGAVPSDESIATLVATKPSISDVIIDGHNVASTNPAVQLDLGAYAKGAALDLAQQVLRKHGIDNAVLNAGGDVNVLGTKGATPWRVAIRDPFEWGAIAMLEVKPGEAVYTSGNYERFLDAGGTRFSHILDPRTGWPVRDVVSVTVLDTNGARADAAATAISVAGPAGWAETLEAMDIANAMLIDGTGLVFVTPDFAKRLQPLGDNDATDWVVTSKPKNTPLG